MSEVFKLEGVTIESGVPVAAGKYGRWSRIAAEMQVGDSVLLPTSAEACSLRAALRRSGAKTKQRTVMVSGAKHWRVWRVERDRGAGEGARGMSLSLKPRAWSARSQHER